MNVTGPARNQNLGVHICALHDTNTRLNLQFFTKNTYPLLVLQVDKTYVQFAVDVDDLILLRDKNSECRESIHRALCAYVYGSSALAHAQPDIEFSYRHDRTVVFRILMSECRTVDLANTDISIMYIVELLLKFKVIFITNIPKHRYHQILEDASSQWSSKLLESKSDAGMRKPHS